MNLHRLRRDPQRLGDLGVCEPALAREYVHFATPRRHLPQCLRERVLDIARSEFAFRRWSGGRKTTGGFHTRGPLAERGLGAPVANDVQRTVSHRREQICANASRTGKREAVLPHPAENEVDDILGLVVAVDIGRGERDEVHGKQPEELFKCDDVTTAHTSEQ